MARCLFFVEMGTGCLAWFCSRVLAHCQVSGFRDRRAPDYTTRQMKMVAREGAAPPIAGCRPAVILFHHRAVEVRFIKLAAGARLAPARPPSKGGVLLIRRPGKEMVGERGLAPPRLTDSRSVGSAIPSEPLARNWPAEPKLDRAKVGAPGRNLTGNHSLRRAAL